MMEFSVLLSVYRKERAPWFRESLTSVFSQTVRPTEVVLVEDGPLTAELDAVVSDFVRREPTLRVVKLPENGGLGHALNVGLRHCRCELVARMDTDDICKPNRFERQLAVFAAHPEVDLCSSWIDEFEVDKDHVTSRRLLPEHHEEIVRYAKSRCPVNHPAVMYKRSVVLGLGGYQGFPEDYYLWVRMLMHGCRFYNVQESLLWFRFPSDVLRRRGGWHYAKDDLRAQWQFKRVGFLTWAEFVRNVSVRLVVRLMPNGCRTWVYRHLLRREGTPSPELV